MTLTATANNHADQYLSHKLISGYAPRHTSLLQLHTGIWNPVWWPDKHSVPNQL